MTRSGAAKGKRLCQCRERRPRRADCSFTHVAPVREQHHRAGVLRDADHWNPGLVAAASVCGRFHLRAWHACSRMRRSRPATLLS